MRIDGKLGWRSDSASASELCHFTECEYLTYPFHMSNSTVCPESGSAHYSGSAGHNGVAYRLYRSQLLSLLSELSTS